MRSVLRHTELLFAIVASVVCGVAVGCSDDDEGPGSEPRFDASSGGVLSDGGLDSGGGSGSGMRDAAAGGATDSGSSLDAGLDAGTGAGDAGGDAAARDAGGDAAASDAGGDATTDSGGGDAGSDAGAGDAGAVSFTRVYQIITANCAPCHVGGGQPSGGLDMRMRATAYSELVGDGGVAPQGSQCDDEEDLLRVVPDEPDESLLIQKLEEDPPCGNRMPAGDAGPLAQPLIDEIRAWIAAGAPNN